MAEKRIEELIAEIKKELVDAGYVRRDLLEESFGGRTGSFRGVKIEGALERSNRSGNDI